MAGIDLGELFYDLSVKKANWDTAISEAKDDTKALEDTFKDSSKTLTTLGSSMTKYVTLPLIGIGAAAVATGAKFDAQMSRVQAIAGATGDELGQLREQALQLGADTAFSAAQAAEGMENLASAGFTTNEILEATPGLLDLAASSGADLGVASEIAASTLRGFGLAASQAGHVADVLADASAKTNAQVEDMGDAMKYVAPVAASMGLSLEETAAAIGIMSDAGIKGSQAGTALRGALARLTKPTDAMTVVMKELGLSFYDSEGKMKSIDGIITMLQGSFEGLTDEQKQNAVTTLFGQESMSGMLSLIAAGPEKLENLTEGFKTSDGAAKDMAETMMNNLKGSVEALGGSVETAGIKIYDLVKDDLQAAVEGVTGLVNAFSDLDAGTQETIIKIAGVAAAIGPTIFVMGKLSGAVGSVITAFSAAGAALSSGSGLLGVLTAAIGPGGVVVLAVVAIAAITAAVIAMSSKIDPAVRKVKEMTKEFDRSWKTYKEGVGQITATTDAASILADELYNLAAKENKTNEEKIKMKSLVAQLNKALPELNLAINEQTYALTKSKDAVEDYIEAKKKELLLQAYEEELLELYKEKAKIEIDMVNATDRLTAAQEAYNQSLAASGDVAPDWEVLEELTNATIAVEGLTTSITANSERIGDVDKAYNTAAAGIVKANDKQVASTTSTTTLTAEQLAQQATALEEHNKAIETEAQNHMTQMGTIEDNGIKKTELTAAQVKKNLDKQIADFRTWRADIQKLAQRVPEDVMTELEKLGPEAEPIIKGLNKMSDKELAAWVKTWQTKSALASSTATDELNKTPAKATTAGKNTDQGFADGLSDEKKGDLIKDKAKHATEDAIMEFDKGHTGAYTAGQQAGRGFADGLLSKSAVVRRAAHDVATSAQDGLKYKLEISSPSKLFKRLGAFTTQGFADGMTGDLYRISKAAKQIALAAAPDIDSSALSVTSAASRLVDMVTKFTLDTGALDRIAGLTPKPTQGRGQAPAREAQAITVNFYGRYTFMDRAEIDYFMNQAELTARRAMA